MCVIFYSQIVLPTALLLLMIVGDCEKIGTLFTNYVMHRVRNDFECCALLWANKLKLMFVNIL